MASPVVPEDAIKQKVIDILKENPSIPGLQSFTSKPDEVRMEQDSLLAEGFVNFLLRMRASDGSTAIVKYVPPYVKAYGPGAPLSQGRAEVEMTALQLFEQHSPGSAPTPYFYSQKHSIILMEDLSGYVMLRTQLLAGNISKLAVEKVAVHIAKIHKSTHKDNVDAQEWSTLQDINKQLSMIEEMAQTFTSYPYIKEPKDEVSRRLKEIADSRVLGNNSLNGVIDQCIKDYVYKKECLIHADTHTKDLLVKGDDVKMIDPEFAHLGPCSADVAMLLAHLVMAYYYHLVSPEENDRHRQMAYKIQDCCYHFGF